MMLMPAWDDQKYFGIKLITATPNNTHTNHAYLNGSYLLFDAKTGIPICMMDAKLITHIRTAATSVLASQFLSRKDASSVLIIGNGNIAKHYIEAYASLENLSKIYLWGRRYKKTLDVIQVCQNVNVDLVAIEDFEDVIKSADIISCITSSEEAIILPEHLLNGQHFDLAGSYTTNMIEMSSEAIIKCGIYVDNMDVTPLHSGEIYQALEREDFTTDKILGTLYDICKDDTSKRQHKDQITVFKSTGMGLEDLVISRLIYEKYNSRSSF